jgi:hypothetical protein
MKQSRVPRQNKVLLRYKAHERSLKEISCAISRHEKMILVNEAQRDGWQQKIDDPTMHWTDGELTEALKQLGEWQDACLLDKWIVADLEPIAKTFTEKLQDEQQRCYEQGLMDAFAPLDLTGKGK